MSIDLIKNRIRDVPDFPKPGILFKDITPLLSDATAFNSCIDLLAEKVQRHKAEALVGIESRGFIFGAALAVRMGLPLELVRKPGKLPYKTHGLSYDLEYGSETVEVHRDAIRPGDRVLMVDDVLATGGTMSACCRLVEKLGGEIVGIAVLIELSFLNGRSLLEERPIHAVMGYDG